MTNADRRRLLNEFRASDMEGSILDVYKAYEQGIDLLAEHRQEQPEQPLVAETQEEQKEGLRPYHEAGEYNQTMVFPDVPPNTPFNTMGMKAPINIEKVDKQGHLVESYKNVPPGISELPTGPYRGDIIESPAQYQKGGPVEDKEKEEKPSVALTFSKSSGLDKDKREGTRIPTFADGTQIPVMLPTAEISSSNNTGLDSVDAVLKRTGAGIVGDYSKIDKSKREEYETGVTKDVSDAGKNMMNVATDVMAWPGRVTTGALLNVASGNTVNKNPFAYTDQARGIEQDNYSPSTTLDLTGGKAMAADILLDPTVAFGAGKGLLGVGKAVGKNLKSPLTALQKVRLNHFTNKVKNIYRRPIGEVQNVVGKAKGRATIRREGDRIMSEIDSKEGRKRLGDLIAEAKTRTGDEALTPWEMSQLVDNRLSSMRGALKSGTEDYGVPLVNNAMYVPPSSMRFIKAPTIKTEGALGSIARRENVLLPKIPGKTTAEASEMYKQLGKKVSKKRTTAVGEGFTSASGESGTIQLGYNANNTAVLEHELGHSMQSGSRTPIDSDVTNYMSGLEKEGKFGKGQIGRDADYMIRGSGFQEGLPFLSETRQHLRDIGLLKNRYDEITPQMLEIARTRGSRASRGVHHGYYSNTANKRTGRRILEMGSGMSDPLERKKFFEKITPLMNKLPAATGVGVAAGVAGQDSKKRGGMKDRRKKRKKRK
tara:strand:- start:2005 stop:4134 length:2130 start_codon:yes stop_codon:yes gene_type:complete